MPSDCVSNIARISSNSARTRIHTVLSESLTMYIGITS